MKKIKINIFIMLLACALTNMITVLILVSYNKDKTVSSIPVQAYLKITVLDIRTHEPLENATVCIPETGIYYTTDKFGRTPTIDVPYLKNGQYDNIKERNWGDITILAYKQGYVDYLVFYIMVTKDKTRHVTLTLAPYTEGSQPYIIIESPDDQWAKDIINKYKK